MISDGARTIGASTRLWTGLGTSSWFDRERQIVALRAAGRQCQFAGWGGSEQLVQRLAVRSKPPELPRLNNVRRLRRVRRLTPLSKDG